MVKILAVISLSLVLVGCSPAPKIRYPSPNTIEPLPLVWYYPQYGYGTKINEIPLGTKVVVLFPNMFQAVQEQLINSRLESNGCKAVIDNHNMTLPEKAWSTVKNIVKKD